MAVVKTEIRPFDCVALAVAADFLEEAGMDEAERALRFLAGIGRHVFVQDWSISHQPVSYRSTFAPEKVQYLEGLREIEVTLGGSGEPVIPWVIEQGVHT